MEKRPAFEWPRRDRRDFLPPRPFAVAQRAISGSPVTELMFEATDLLMSRRRAVRKDFQEAGLLF